MSMSVGTHYSSNYVGIALVKDNAYSIWELVRRRYQWIFQR